MAFVMSVRLNMYKFLEAHVCACMDVCSRVRNKYICKNSCMFVRIRVHVFAIAPTVEYVAISAAV